jgi:hypothetical protein
VAPRAFNSRPPGHTRNFAQIVNSTSRVPLVLCCYTDCGQAQKNARLRDLTPLFIRRGLAQRFADRQGDERAGRWALRNRATADMAQARRHVL